MSQKKKKSVFDELFGGSLFGEFENVFERIGEEKEIDGGYSISVSQTPQGTKVHAKVGEDADVNALKKSLQKQYPGAQIEIEGGRPLIREIETKPVKEKNKRDN